MKSKGGFTITTIIIGVAVLLIAFGIVFFFLFRIDIPGYGVDGVCKFSVLSRATIFSEGRGLIPLKCPTKKFCIKSLFGGGCGQFAGEKVDGTERVIGDAKDDFERIVAGQVISCWETLGKGRLDLYTNKGLISLLIPDFVDNIFEGEKLPMCVICSRIALEKDLESASKELNLLKYFKNNRAPDGSGLNYLQSFTDKQIESYPREIENNFRKGIGNDGTNEVAVLFMQVISNEPPAGMSKETENQESIASYNNILIVGDKILTSSGSVIDLKGVLGDLVGVDTSEEKNRKVGVKSDNAVAVGHCGVVQSVKEGGPIYGCSVVRVVDYNDVKQLNKLCRNQEALFG
jgi:hypothetical protein